MGMRIFAFMACLLIGATSSLQADQVAATQLMKNYKRSLDSWMDQMAAAGDTKERQELFDQRPDPALQLERLWRQVQNHLDEQWVIEPLAWMLERPEAWSGIPERERVGAFNSVMDGIEHALVISPDISKVMPALAVLEHQRCLGVVNKVIQTNPSPRVKAAAHVSAALILRRIGDGPKVMNQRKEHLRKALELGGNAPFGRRLVIDMVKDELYRVKYLNVGRQAPTFQLLDQDGLQVDLANYRGRVVVLVFWNLRSATALRQIPVMNALLTDMGQLANEVALLGVVNNQAAELRNFLKDTELKFDNLVDPGGRVAADYRVDLMPMVYILDQQGRIAYKGELSPLLRPKIEELAVTGEKSLLPDLDE